MRFGLRAKIGQINIALLVTSHSQDLQPGHDRAGGIGAVGGGRDETHVAMPFAPAGVIGADDEQTCVLALRTRIGLQRDSSKSRDLGQPLLQLLENNLVAAGLSQRRERMEAAEFRPGERQHFHRRIELHRA